MPTSECPLCDHGVVTVAPVVQGQGSVLGRANWRAGQLVSCPLHDGTVPQQPAMIVPLRPTGNVVPLRRAGAR